MEDEVDVPKELVEEEEKIDFSSANDNSELKPLVTLDSLVPSVKYDYGLDHHDADHDHDHELKVDGHVHNPDECDEC